MPVKDKKIVFSGVQPSGNLHIGNYLGAISQWIDMQDEYNCIFCVVDYHAITVKQNPKLFKKKIYEVAKVYLASGIDPKRANIFLQSDIHYHTELAWILNTIARMSDLFRMTQFKDKTKIDPEKIIAEISKRIIYNTETFIISSEVQALIKELFSGMYMSSVGLFDYPVLMAADILLYNTDIVPVGEDQAQHVELARELARRFNKEYGLTFKEPQVKLLKEGARIMGLDDPSKKMSKSAVSSYNYIALTDKPEEAMRKVMRAVTDSGREIIFNREQKPAITNLLTIYSLLTGESIKVLEKKYKNSNYREFKTDLAEVVREFLINFQNKYNNISDADVRNIMHKSAENIRPIAEATIKRVKERLGIL